MRAVKTRHFLQLVLLSALWGASFLFIRVASPVLGPNVMAALRIGLATLTLMGIMRWAGEPWPWRHWRELLGLGTLTVAAPFLLYAWAALHLPAGYSSLLNTMVVPFGVLTAAWMKEDTLSARKWLGCLCGFVGVALIVQRVLGDFDEDTRVFDHLLQDFLAFSQEERRRSDLLEQRTRDAEEGRARTLQARHQVQQLLNQRLRGLDVPSPGALALGEGPSGQPPGLSAPVR